MKFACEESRDGRVRIFGDQRLAVTLKGRDAARFLSRVDGSEPDEAQLLMARATGQFKFGNERTGKRRHGD